MANELPPNLPIPPIPPAGGAPATGFDVPDPFEDVSSMPDKTSQPNPLIVPPEVDESLETDQPVFVKPEMPTRKRSAKTLVFIVLGVVILLIAVIAAIAIKMFSGSSVQKTAADITPTPTVAPVQSQQPVAVESSTPPPTSSAQIGSDGDDPDKDGVNNAEERLYGTDPNNPDTDGDGYDDGEEVKNGYNPLGQGSLDSDNDGLTDPVERKMGTDPFNPDTDGDGYSDGDEVAHGHNPLVPAPNDKL